MNTFNFTDDELGLLTELHEIERSVWSEMRAVLICEDGELLASVMNHLYSKFVCHQSELTNRIIAKNNGRNTPPSGLKENALFNETIKFHYFINGIYYAFEGSSKSNILKHMDENNNHLEIFSKYH